MHTYHYRIAQSATLLQTRLKAYRQARGVTQAFVATAIGIEKKQIHQYETGKLFPGMRTLIKLCEFYQTTPNYLLGFKEQ